MSARNASSSIRLPPSLLLPRQGDVTDVTEAQVGGRVVPLDTDRPGLLTVPVAWVVVGRPVVGPVYLLHAVDPRRDVSAAGDDGHRKPFTVLRHRLAGRHAAVDRPSAEVLRPRQHLARAGLLAGRQVVLVHE